MAIRNVIKVGDPLLKQVSHEITRFDDWLSRLIDDMFDTMRYENGVGLAAVQVGVARRVCVIEFEDTVLELVNPKIIFSEGVQSSTEGCLSVPNKQGIVARPQKVVVSAFDRHQNQMKIEAEDYLATIICHELDHLDGVIFLDRATKVLREN